MNISDILVPACTQIHFSGGSKKRVLTRVSELIKQGARLPFDSKLIVDCLLSRERLGSTSIGEGVAIPHGRLSELNQAIGSLVLLDEKIDFNAVDHQGVDIIFTLLVPEQATEEHLQVLSALAEMFNNSTIREHLRQATSHQALYDMVVQYGG